jgi:hypothetical protein
MKNLTLKINNCSECPYFNYNSSFEEHECMNIDNGKLLFTDDYFKDGQYIIFENCPLEDSE